MDAHGTIFVSSKGTGNGIAARVADIEGRKKYKAGAITVALKGSVLSAFLQVEDFYIAHQTAVLYPKRDMDSETKLFYCACISANAYRYNYGRQADRTLKSILVPEYVPKELRPVKLSGFPVLDKAPCIYESIGLNISNWLSFDLDKLFDIKKGKRLTIENMDDGDVPFIGAIDSNNGYRDFIRQEPIHNSNTITVNYNGSVAEAFYQPLPFWASDDVNVLYPKFELNPYIGLFIATIIRLEKYRFNYGRKWHKERMEKSQITLPSKNGKPDFVFMERFIKSLPYSSAISEMQSAKIRKPAIKKQTELSDELVKKYDVGERDLAESLEMMLQQSPTVSVKSEKQTKKR